MQAAVALLAFLFFFFPSNTLAKTATDVFEQASPSVVIVEALDSKGKPLAFGSGVVIATGEVVTNAHVIKGADALRVGYGDKRYPAKVHFTDWDRDLCQLTVAGLSAPAAGTGSTKGLKTGGRVYAIGAPQGLELTLSEGIISSLRPIDGGQYIQITAPISKGSSGGGLFDESGRLIGITSFYVSEGQNLNFAVPVEWVGELPKRTQAKPAPSGGTSLDWWKKCLELQSKKDWQGYLAHSQNWVNAEPRNLDAWATLGLAYNNVNQPANAIEAYQQALRLDPDNARAWEGLGFAYLKMIQPAKAIEACQQALLLDSSSANTWCTLGSAYEYNQPTRAIEAYQQALRLDPDYGLAWDGLGSAYKKTHQPTKAINAYQQALRLDPDNVIYFMHLGSAYKETNQPTRAIEALQKALSKMPDFSPAWVELGLVYAKTGNRTKVMEVYSRLKAYDPSMAEVFFKLAVLP